MTEYLNKQALLAWLKKRLDETQFVREARALAEIVAKIECGRFDFWQGDCDKADVVAAQSKLCDVLSTTAEPTNAAKVERFECPCCGCEISINAPEGGGNA